MAAVDLCVGNWFARPEDSCMHCGNRDFDSSAIGPRWFLLCSSCRASGSHVECHDRANNTGEGRELARSQTDWFCSEVCKTVHETLASFVGVRRHIGEESQEFTVELVEYDESNRGSKATIDNALRLFKSAFGSMQMPNGVEFIELICKRYETPDSEVSAGIAPGYDYRDFRVVVLRKFGTVISAATVRVFGDRFAEMPFIATAEGYRREGHCRRLMKGLTSLLRYAGVNFLVVPCLKQLTSFWRDKMGMLETTASERKHIEKWEIVSPDARDVTLLKRPLLSKGVEGGSTLTGVDSAMQTKALLPLQPSAVQNSQPSQQECSRQHSGSASRRRRTPRRTSGSLNTEFETPQTRRSSRGRRNSRGRGGRSGTGRGRGRPRGKRKLAAAAAQTSDATDDFGDDFYDMDDLESIAASLLMEETTPDRGGEENVSCVESDVRESDLTTRLGRKRRVRFASINENQPLQFDQGTGVGRADNGSNTGDTMVDGIKDEVMKDGGGKEDTAGLNGNSVGIDTPAKQALVKGTLKRKEVDTGIKKTRAVGRRRARKNVGLQVDLKGLEPSPKKQRKNDGVEEREKRLCKALSDAMKKYCEDRSAELDSRARMQEEELQRLRQENTVLRDILARNERAHATGRITNRDHLVGMETGIASNMCGLDLHMGGARPPNGPGEVSARPMSLECINLNIDEAIDCIGRRGNQPSSMNQPHTRVLVNSVQEVLRHVQQMVICTERIALSENGPKQFGGDCGDAKEGSEVIADSGEVKRDSSDDKECLQPNKETKFGASHQWEESKSACIAEGSQNLKDVKKSSLSPTQAVTPPADRNGSEKQAAVPVNDTPDTVPTIGSEVKSETDMGGAMNHVVFNPLFENEQTHPPSANRNAENEMAIPRPQIPGTDDEGPKEHANGNCSHKEQTQLECTASGNNGEVREVGARFEIPGLGDGGGKDTEDNMDVCENPIFNEAVLGGLDGINAESPVGGLIDRTTSPSSLPQTVSTEEILTKGDGGAISPGEGGLLLSGGNWNGKDLRNVLEAAEGADGCVDGNVDDDKENRENSAVKARAKLSPFERIRDVSQAIEENIRRASARQFNEGTNSASVDDEQVDAALDTISQFLQ